MLRRFILTVPWIINSYVVSSMGGGGGGGGVGARVFNKLMYIHV